MSELWEIPAIITFRGDTFPRHLVRKGLPGIVLADGRVRERAAYDVSVYLRHRIRTPNELPGGVSWRLLMTAPTNGVGHLLAIDIGNTSVAIGVFDGDDAPLEQTGDT